MSDSEKEEMDYGKEVTFSDSEAENQPTSKLLEVSEKTRTFLTDKCTWRLQNGDRMQWHSPYPLPKVPASQLDNMMKLEASSTTKAVDKQLPKV